MKYKHEYGVELEELIGKISKERDKKLLREFLFDLLSHAEYSEMAVRWQIVKMLKAKIPHREIAKRLKVGVATINRGVKELLNKNGGFNTIWKKYYKK